MKLNIDQEASLTRKDIIRCYFEVYPSFSFEDQFNKIVVYVIHDLNDHTLPTSVLILICQIPASRSSSWSLQYPILFFSFLGELPWLRMDLAYVSLVPSPTSYSRSIQVSNTVIAKSLGSRYHHNYRNWLFPLYPLISSNITSAHDAAHENPD